MQILKQQVQPVIIVSLPTVLVGVIKYASRGANAPRTLLGNTIAPMGIGSVIGAIIGGMLVGIVPPRILKVTLGIILNIYVFRVFHKVKSSNGK
ncbi:TSUP family transporter [Nostoc sp.]|uniref:TSUP family transporter n=1 Tax=Nostoc sp. TaxID=1180 RepID=UPI003FA5C289